MYDIPPERRTKRSRVVRKNETIPSAAAGTTREHKEGSWQEEEDSESRGVSPFGL